ncbi:MAG: type II toxin-antitoxin system RelE/ParE family toxin [Burkholderiaceae bacterium]
MKIVFHPAAQGDLEEAAEFYEREGSPALAARFVAEFKRLSTLMLQHPGIGSPRTRGRRAFSMSIFPYTVIYSMRGDELHVLVVKHDKRRPGYGGSRVIAS